jgi:hypothetical protein
VSYRDPVHLLLSDMVEHGSAFDGIVAMPAFGCAKPYVEKDT